MIDADLSRPEDNIFCFCPTDENENVITGMSYLAPEPPLKMKLIGVFSLLGGSDRADEFYEKYKDKIERML